MESDLWIISHKNPICMEEDVWIIFLNPEEPNLHGRRCLDNFSHSKRTKSAWRKKISGFLSLHKNPICMRKRRSLDFSLTPQGT
jgi:hypothetical protein